MKLEDIKLQLGDKITFDGTILNAYKNIGYVQDEKELDINTWNKEHITKIERYVQDGLYEGYTEAYMTYRLKTIWERKEEYKPKDIEELSEGTSCVSWQLETVKISKKVNELVKAINYLLNVSDSNKKE